jgi:hypothetical protein
MITIVCTYIHTYISKIGILFSWDPKILIAGLYFLTLITLNASFDQQLPENESNIRPATGAENRILDPLYNLSNEIHRPFDDIDYRVELPIA